MTGNSLDKSENGGTMDIAVHECRALDVRDANTDERLGWVVNTGEKKTPWVAIAIIPADGRNQFLGAFPTPKKSIAALLANERELAEAIA